MKMRIVFLVLLLVMIALALTGCATESKAGEHNPFEDRFAIVGVNNTIKVIIDRTTGVCYLWRKSGYGAGMTVLLDADGTPLTYSEAWYQTYQEADHAPD